MDPAEAQSPSPAPAPRQVLALAGLLVATFFASVWLFTRANSQSYLYHPDEPEKTFQVYRNYRNHRHPQLLLEVTEAAVALRHTPADPQATVEVGRSVSAIFAAMAVTVLTMLGFVLAGWGGAVASAVLVGTSPFLLVNAHYMKEDTALIMGLAMVTLAGVQFARAATPGRRFSAAGLLGFACAVAASGKYVGLLALLPAAALVLTPKPCDRRDTLRRFAAFLAAFLVLLVAINYRLLFEFGIFTNSMKYHGATPLLGHGGTKMAWPSDYYLRVFHHLAGLHVELLALAAVGMLVVRRRRRLADAIPFLLAATCTMLLLGLRSAFPRYALPAIVLTTATAALGVAWTSRLLPSRARAAWVAALVVLCGAIQWRTCATFVKEFEDDSRDRLRGWIAANLRPGDRVAADAYTGRFWAFGGEQSATIGHAIRIDAAPSAADVRGSLADLRAAGYTHVAVSAAAYDRYFDSDLQPLPHLADEFNRRGAWYRDLFSHAQLVWQSEPALDTMAYTNPPLRLYRLPDVANVAEAHAAK